MNNSIFISTFGLVFLAELGDKTQLTAMALSCRYPWRKIFFGIAAAFTLLNLFAVLAGKLLFAFLPIFWVNIASAILFLYFGYSALKHASSAGNEDDTHPPTAATAARTAFIMIFMSELGDKTQLVTASQAAKHAATLYRAGMVFVSSTLALWLVALIGIFVGRQMLRYIPVSWMHRSAGVVFIVFGLLALWQSRMMY